MAKACHGGIRLVVGTDVGAEVDVFELRLNCSFFVCCRRARGAFIWSRKIIDTGCALQN